jgi:hypothetical protein
MYATWHLKADEFNVDVIQNLKDVYHQREIAILPKDICEERETERHNAALTQKLLQSMRDIEEGRGIVKVMEDE